MRTFYKKALNRFLCTAALAGVIGFICLSQFMVKDSLIAPEESGLRWQSEADAAEGESSWITLLDDTNSIHFTAFLGADSEPRFAKVNLAFVDEQAQPRWVDLSRYDNIQIRVRCSVANTLSFTLLIFDDQISKPGDLLSYRAPSTFFACNPSAQTIELDLALLEIPPWWFEAFGVPLSRWGYNLREVAKISIDSSFQSPVGTAYTVQIDQLTLIGYRWGYVYWLVAMMAVLWCGFGVWLWRVYQHALVREMHTRLQQQPQTIAYQQIALASLRDRDKQAVFGYMAAHYADTDLSLDAMTAQIGVTRTKINEILKAELGLTFTGYLNRLRLSEAARLLAQAEAGKVTDIAAMVGYKSTAYFNKLFKEEYGCTPMIYKRACAERIDTST